MMIEKIEKDGYEIRLFSKNKYYFVNGQWVRYVEKLVNGKVKIMNQIMCVKELSDIYQEIQSIWNSEGVIVATRKTKADNFKWLTESSEVPIISNETQFMRPVNLVVKKLRDIDKVSLRAMLVRDGVTFIEFEDIKGVTRIKTSSKGYRLLSLII